MTSRAAAVPKETIAIRIRLRGRVQGIGMRPAIVRLAHKSGVSGTVLNDGEGVDVHAEGSRESVREFLGRLQESLPAAAVIEAMSSEATSVRNATEFVIRFANSLDQMSTRVPPEIVVCRDCLGEITDKSDRRFRYPFTSCTNCGPRYTIILAMPYERHDTSMNAFAFCDQCACEYESPLDRRFHAQTNACPDCGPVVWAANAEHEMLQRNDEAIELAADAISEGKIVAIKGVGGYQLLCDATNDVAVNALRLQKRRLRKPFPIMVTSDSRFAGVAKRTLSDPANAIVISDMDFAGLAPSINPGLSDLGVMLPTTPLHFELVNRTGRPLVVTSANREGDPLEFENEPAVQSLGTAADLYLHHDRQIVRPMDDSVVRIIANQSVTIRAARGIAPLPLQIASPHQILAVGGHQKVALALSNGHQSVLGPHVGDMSSESARGRFANHVDDLCRLYHCAPQVVAHDLHPEYFTTTWAASRSTKTIAVQHHHAHIVSGMLQHGWLNDTVVGIVCDGTGYGTDGTIWGGEILIASVDKFDRVGTFRPFVLAGGEAAIRRPWRIAMALLGDAKGKDVAVNYFAAHLDAGTIDSVNNLLQRGIGPRTSSLGRIFDGVAALLLPTCEATYEGEPAAMLEAICNRSEPGYYPTTRARNNGLAEIDWRPLVAELVRDLDNRVPAAVIAMRFHRGIALAIASLVAQYREYRVVISGGCFQNRVLTELLAENLSDHQREIGLPGRIPPNDGGLAAGQLAVAAATLSNNEQESV